MAYRHGVYISEVPTSILPPVQADAGIPFIVGTAPVGMTDESNVNRPVLCYTYAEAVAAFGYVAPKPDAATGLKTFEYTICEAIYSQFALNGVAPVIIVNVLDPKKHANSAAASSITIPEATGSVVVKETGVIPSTVRISTAEGTVYSAGEDYELTFDDDGFAVISSLKDAEGKIAANEDAINGLKGDVKDLQEAVEANEDDIKALNDDITELTENVAKDLAGLETKLTGAFQTADADLQKYHLSKHQLFHGISPLLLYNFFNIIFNDIFSISFINNKFTINKFNI